MRNERSKQQDVRESSIFPPDDGYDKIDVWNTSPSRELSVTQHHEDGHQEDAAHVEGDDDRDHGVALLHQYGDRIIQVDVVQSELSRSVSSTDSGLTNIMNTEEFQAGDSTPPPPPVSCSPSTQESWSITPEKSKRNFSPSRHRSSESSSLLREPRRPSRTEEVLETNTVSDNENNTGGDLRDSINIKDIQTVEHDLQVSDCIIQNDNHTFNGESSHQASDLDHMEKKNNSNDHYCFELGVKFVTSQTAVYRITTLLGSLLTLVAFWTVKNFKRTSY